MSVAHFLGEWERAVREGTFHWLNLARPAAGESRRNLNLRPAVIRGDAVIQITHRYATRNDVENLPADKTVKMIAALLGTSFLDAHLETDEATFSLRFSRRGEPRLSRKKHPSSSVVSIAHDRRKARRLDPARLPWLVNLGLADREGNLLPSRSAKWRQVERFVELIEHAWRDVNWVGGRPLEIFDMGSGKGYLTFAVEAWFGDVSQIDARVHGIEQRPELVELCNAIAVRHQRAHLSFQTGQIGDADLPQLDILIALHACNTATDDALALGIRRGSEMIVVAPCCQHELREKMPVAPGVAGLLEHGLFRQRQAALLTDALRTLILEREGYKVRVVEFVSSEHTDKNLLLIATHSRRKSATAQSKIDQLKTLFELPALHLETLLTPC